MILLLPYLRPPFRNKSRKQQPVFYQSPTLFVAFALSVFGVGFISKLDDSKPFAPLPLQKFRYYYDSVCPHLRIGTLISRILPLDILP
jgi:hypothetical protein